jgi:site-specific recombinase XerD
MSSDTPKRHKAARKTGTGIGTMELTAKLPKGISIGQWSPRPKPFFVRYGKDRTVESFATEEQRNDRAEELLVIRENEGRSALDYSRRDWEEFLEWRKIKRRDVLTVTQAVTKYLSLRLAEDLREDSDTHLHLKKHLEQRLTEVLGETPLNRVTTEDLREWLYTLPFAKVTIKNHRKDVNTFFERCVAEEWIDRNPCRAVKPPRVDEEPKTPLTPVQIFALLHANRIEPVMGRLALELFGGLRYSSAGRLTYDHLDFTSKGIAMPGQGHKSGKWKYRQGHPAVLWDWLSFVPKEAFGAASVSNYGHQKSLAFARAQMANPGNALRESFASYYLAVTKSYQQVGYIMQHTRVGTTMIYEGIVKEEDARIVFAMTPEAVKGTFEDFLAKPIKNQ